MNPMLMRAVVEAIVFAGLSNDDVIQQDAAVAQLEQLGSILKGLPPQERAAFVKYVQAMATVEERDHGRSARVEFLFSIPENLGLTE
jgi:hypothetical protein